MKEKRKEGKEDGSGDAGRMGIGTVFVSPRVGNQGISYRRGAVLDYCRGKKNEVELNMALVGTAADGHRRALRVRRG